MSAAEVAPLTDAQRIDAMLALVDELAAACDAVAITTEQVGWALNPLVYARAMQRQLIERYGLPATRSTARRALLVGMNPGPWGMGQTGIPFGDPVLVRDWIGLDAPIHEPDPPCPLRPILGLSSARREGSGQRFWGWAKERYQTPAAFFDAFFVWNYCPLLLLDRERATNRTPDKLTAADKRALLPPCDRALAELVALLEPTHVIGVGGWATVRCRAALAHLPNAPPIATILHPSPAANQGWAAQVTAQLDAIWGEGAVGQ
jgi:single-strand selective monofunctional uracil DNA glycosylase